MDIYIVQLHKDASDSALWNITNQAYKLCFLIHLNTISNKAGQLKLFCKMTLSIHLQ